MLDVHIAEVNNGYIVNIQKHEEKPTGGFGAGMDIGKLMEQGMKTAMKIQNQDDVLADIHDKNKKTNENYLGTSVFSKFEDAVGFIKLAKSELEK